MARHGLHKKAPQLDLENLPASITFGAPTDGASSLTFAASASALTTLITTQTLIEPASGRTDILTRTTVITSAVTDASQYNSLTSAEAALTSSSSRTSSSTPSATSSAAAAKPSSNLSTLIPAIVVPVVVVLLASFGLFWFFMRRRHRREVKNADFVMAGKAEKLSSRTNSSRSAGTITTAAEKATAMVTISELKPPPSSHPSGPKYSMEDIGVARPLTPRDGTGPGSPRRPQNDRSGPPREQRPYQNFSGPRPNTARDRGQPPPQIQSRNRSNSTPGKRGPPPSAYNRGPPLGRPSPDLRGGPSPSPRIGTGPSPVQLSGAFPSARGLPEHPRPAPPAPRMRDTSPTLNHTSRAAPPATLQAPPPGAFNGASSISQYSPIVKETPQLGSGPLPGPIGVAGTIPPKPKTSDGSKPPPLNTNNLTSTTTARSMSPTSPSGNFLTEENMRIARLANSSRLGFFNTSATSPSADKGLTLNAPPKPTPFSNTIKTSAPGQSPATTSNPSPKLPPPATRSQLIPNDSPRDDRKAPYNYFTAGTSNRASPTASFAQNMGGHSQPHHHQTHGHRERDDDEESNVSDLEYYEDIDAKSDVSSLNELELFEFESHRGSHRGSGSVRGLGFDSPSGYR